MKVSNSSKKPTTKKLEPSRKVSRQERRRNERKQLKEHFRKAKNKILSILERGDRSDDIQRDVYPFLRSQFKDIGTVETTCWDSHRLSRGILWIAVHPRHGIDAFRTSILYRRAEVNPPYYVSLRAALEEAVAKIKEAVEA